jgi:hypothetical protein
MSNGSSQKPLALPAVIAVAGVSFHAASQEVCVGEKLEIRIEVGNPFDPSACVVLRKGEVVGHVPKALAERLRRTGAGCWPTEVSEVLPGPAATGLRVRVLPGHPAEPWRAAAVSDALSPDAESPTPSPGETLSETMTAAVERTTDRAGEGRLVRARSGRVLGTYVGSIDGALSVLTEDGRKVRYPSSLVVLEAAP